MTQYYSQFGEDEWIIQNLPLPKHGFFVEIGVGADGLLHSNTKTLEDMGWYGVLVEADPSVYDTIRQNRNCTVKSTGLAGYSGLIKFVLCENKELSGTLRSESEGQSIEIPCSTIDELFGGMKIDLMSIDTEGNEIDILNAIGDLRPSILIVEYNTMGMEDNYGPLLDKLESLGYKQVHKTTCNIIAIPNLKQNEISI